MANPLTWSFSATRPQRTSRLGAPIQSAHLSMSRREHLAIDKVQATEGVHDYFVLASEAEFRPSHRTCGHSRCYSHDLLFPVV